MLLNTGDWNGGFGELGSLVESFTLLLLLCCFSSVEREDDRAGIGCTFFELFADCLLRQTGFSGTREGAGGVSPWSVSSVRLVSSEKQQKENA